MEKVSTVQAFLLSPPPPRSSTLLSPDTSPFLSLSSLADQVCLFWLAWEVSVEPYRTAATALWPSSKLYSCYKMFGRKHLPLYWGGGGERGNHGLINNIDFKAKCRHLKKLTSKGTLRQVFIKVYRLEIHTFSLVQLSPTLPPFTV